MAVEPEELQALRDALIRARASGIRSVEYGDGRRVVYQDETEMARALADLEVRLRSGAAAPIRTVSFTSSKGI